ncbi:MAG: DUF1549 domain-containing protein [Planctomycetes bacterium]|nr:DUF1549 domain-containing protein [Planctomycetota bacterium]
MKRQLLFVGLLFALLGAGFALVEIHAGGATPKTSHDPEKEKFFEKEVKPILQANCFRCHGAESKIKGKLRLTSRDDVLKGGASGPAVSLKTPDKSLILDAINYRDLEMPPKGKLSQSQIDILTKWVKMGVPWSSSKVKATHGVPVVDDAAKNFWAFRPVSRSPKPEVKDTAWVKNPIDAFILAKLEAAGLKPAPPADRGALLRRVYYDLIGLPPTPEEVDAFMKDDRPDAYGRLLDRLLASPHYGEHWARHWLDVVRYAETNSFERDSAKPFIWRYRDYVIRAFNEDKTYNQFIREQIAGDELDQITPDTLIATGYYRLGIWDDEAPDKLLAFYDDLEDIANTTGQAFLGLTVGCARCHDHKIDPFPQKDYYRFLAFFHNIRRYGDKGDLRPIGSPEEIKKLQSEIAAIKKRLSETEKQIAEIEDAVKPKLAGGERDDFNFDQNRPLILKKNVGKLIDADEFAKYEALQKQREKIRREQPSAMNRALCVGEFGNVAKETFVLARGNPQAKGDKVEPGFPTVLTDAKANVPKESPFPHSAGRRRVLADWIADSNNSLSYRVWVNRIWQWHFGRGIVRSSSNFGYMGNPPTHPELLDWLTSEFIAGGMKLRDLHRLIMLSNTYQMSARADDAALAKDPENDHFWRFNMRRLSAEEIRDSILAASGNLNLKAVGGPSVFPVIPKEVLAGQSVPGNGWGASTPEERARRSVYVHIKRSLAVPFLVNFDVPDTDAPCPVRFTTTQPTQALGLLNSEFLNEQAKIFADHVRKGATTPADQVKLTLRRTTQRTPTQAEIDRGVRFLSDMQERHSLSADEALRRFCLLALNLNEFVFLD